MRVSAKDVSYQQDDWRRKKTLRGTVQMTEGNINSGRRQEKRVDCIRWRAKREVVETRKRLFSNVRKRKGDDRKEERKPWGERLAEEQQQEEREWEI